MKRMAARRPFQAWWVVLLAGSGALAGCRDSGLPDRNLPREQAEQRTYGYPAYQAVGAALAEVWELNGRRWQLSAQVETIAQSGLRSVANANGTAMYALRWDREPFDRLYTPVGENRWRVVTPID
ncbi:MAG TPA: hypothetical protein VK939_06760 [Longimicrobiales bacterium]|nr:hypothetical protein [Longimicrobiales bacterium]